jgi:hypothetical protein
MIALIWLAMLACRSSDVFLARGGTATLTPTRPRPTFTLSAIIVPEEPTNPPPPTVPPPRPPTSRPAPVRIPPTATKPPAPTTVPPTPDPDAGFYYRRVFKGCAAASNTRIEGTVIDGGTPRSGVKVRLSFEENGPADTPLPDFLTGTDPADPKHPCPACQGKYRLSPSEGSLQDGNWWVYVVDDSGNPLSKSVFIHTQDGPGCNTATVDFVH